MAAGGLSCGCIKMADSNHAVPVVYTQCCVGGPGGGSGGSVGRGKDPTLGVSSNLGGLCLLVGGLRAVPRISVSSSVNRGKEPTSSEGLMNMRTSSTRPPSAGASEGSLFLSFVMEADSFEVVHSRLPPPHSDKLLYLLWHFQD